MKEAMQRIEPREENYDAWWAVYNADSSKQCQKGASVAAYAIDRKCLREYTDASTQDSIQELICFCCARKFPHIAVMGDEQIIDWVSVCRNVTDEGELATSQLHAFMGMDYEGVRTLLSLELYFWTNTASASRTAQTSNSTWRNFRIGS